MLLITVEDHTVFDIDPSGTRPDRVSTSHFLTTLTVPEFVIAYSAEIAEQCERFAGIGMRCWFNIQNVCDVGEPSAEQIESMVRTTHFPVRLFPEGARHD